MRVCDDSRLLCVYDACCVLQITSIRKVCVGDCSDPLNFVSKLSAGNTRRHKEQTAKM